MFVFTVYLFTSPLNLKRSFPRLQTHQLIESHPLTSNLKPQFYMSSGFIACLYRLQVIIKQDGSNDGSKFQ